MPNSVMTEIDVDAPPERVWEVLTDFAAYPRWNPFIVRAEGTAAPGSRITLRIRSAAGWSATNKARIQDAVPGVALRWSARLIPIPGLAAGRHEFTLNTTGTGTHVRHCEHFSGALVPLIGKLLVKTERDFRLLNEALKKECENG